MSPPYDTDNAVGELADLFHLLGNPTRPSRRARLPSATNRRGRHRRHIEPVQFTGQPLSAPAARGTHRQSRTPGKAGLLCGRQCPGQQAAL